ncbi:hypothetical protein Tco_0431093 [Tanacetum coccineum]
MAHSENNTLSSAFKTFFERETLTGPNFNDWYRSLRIVLRVADTFDYLYKPCPGQPADTATEAEKAAFKVEYKKHLMWHVLCWKNVTAIPKATAPVKPRPLTRILGDFCKKLQYAYVGMSVTELHAAAH